MMVCKHTNPSDRFLFPVRLSRHKMDTRFGSPTTPITRGESYLAKTGRYGDCPEMEPSGKRVAVFRYLFFAPILCLRFRVCDAHKVSR